MCDIVVFFCGSFYDALQFTLMLACRGCAVFDMSAIAVSTLLWCSDKIEVASSYYNILPNR